LQLTNKRFEGYYKKHFVQNNCGGLSKKRKTRARVVLEKIELVGGEMKEWMSEWINERMDKWMNKWMNEWMDKWMNKWMNEWMNKWMNEWINEWMNE